MCWHPHRVHVKREIHFTKSEPSAVAFCGTHRESSVNELPHQYSHERLGSVVRKRVSYCAKIMNLFAQKLAPISHRTLVYHLQAVKDRNAIADNEENNVTLVRMTKQSKKTDRAGPASPTRSYEMQQKGKC